MPNVLDIVGLLSQTPTMIHGTQLMHLNGRQSSLTLRMPDLNSPRSAPCSYASKHTAHMQTVWRHWPWWLMYGVGHLRVESRRDNIDMHVHNWSRTSFRQILKKLTPYIPYSYRYLVHFFVKRPSRAAEGQWSSTVHACTLLSSKKMRTYYIFFPPLFWIECRGLYVS